jgi:hypothetical protein
MIRDGLVVGGGGGARGHLFTQKSPIEVKISKYAKFLPQLLIFWFNDFPEDK